MPPPKKNSTAAKGAKPEGEEEEEAEEGAEGGAQGLTVAEVNKIIGTRLKRFEKGLTKGIESAVTSVLAKAGVVKPGDEEDEEDEDEDEEGAEGAAPPAAKTPKAPAEGGAPPARAAKPDRRVSKLQRELDAMKAEREKERRDAQAREERDTLSGVLRDPEMRVRPELVGPLVVYLRSEENGRIVRRNDEGKVVFVSRDADGEEDELPLREGLSAWLKTDAGKPYAAPTGAGGSGTPPKQGGGGGARSPARQQGGPSNTELDATLAGFFTGQKPPGQG